MGMDQQAMYAQVPPQTPSQQARPKGVAFSDVGSVAMTATAVSNAVAAVKAGVAKPSPARQASQTSAGGGKPSIATAAKAAQAATKGGAGAAKTPAKKSSDASSKSATGARKTSQAAGPAKKPGEGGLSKVLRKIVE